MTYTYNSNNCCTTLKNKQAVYLNSVPMLLLYMFQDEMSKFTDSTKTYTNIGSWMILFIAKKYKTVIRKCLQKYLKTG